MSVHLGVQLVLKSWADEDIVSVVREVEDLDFASLWLGDHVVLPNGFNSEYPYSYRFPELKSDDLFPSKEFPGILTTAGYICGCTTRLKVGFGVLLASMRNAVVTAKELGSLHALSGQRLIVGVGSGWLKEEFEAVNASFADRGRVLDETIDVMRALWDPHQPVSFQGEHYNFSEVYCEPTPGELPPIWIGGQSEVALRRTALRGDGWYALELDGPGFVAASKRLGELSDELGRDPATIERAVVARFNLSGSKAVGTELIEQYLEAGCDHLIIFATPSRTAAENLKRFERFRSEVDRLGVLDRHPPAPIP